mmetsp:Transcript_82493/g.218919  ORF Transcript_82493/g.218919 Transcript_82493/m.218919 type:complete len:219 (-) Transcript_82493:144-800(-)
MAPRCWGGGCPPPGLGRCAAGRCLMPVSVGAAEHWSGGRGSYVVQVGGEHFKFSCAHFVAYEGFRERLHGHNYTVSVRLSGTRNGDGYVLDFGDAKRAIRHVCKELNEHLIVPMRSNVITVHVDSERQQLEMLCEDGARFLLPLGDCVLLPLVHSTAEELAEYLHGRLTALIGEEKLQRRCVQWMEVSVSERPVQSATFEKDLDYADETASPDGQSRL